MPSFARALWLSTLLVSPACNCELRSLATDDGRTRTYLVHEPAGASGPLPVVLVLHGGGGNAEGTRRTVGMDDVADEEGFLAVYPNGIGKSLFGRDFNTWNAAEECCGVALDEGVDDVAFLAALLDALAGDYDVDETRVYATGISNGGDMSHRLACQLSERVTAAAPIAAPHIVDECAPARPVPVMIFHGTDDQCALYEGGEACGGCWSRALDEGWGIETSGNDTFPCTSAPAQAEEWRERNGCSDVGATVYDEGAAVCESFSDGCTAGDVVLCTIEGGGHTWPGAEYGCDPSSSRACRAYVDQVGSISHDIDANREMWRFFERFTLD